jgi:hypothetical protein
LSCNNYHKTDNTLQVQKSRIDENKSWFLNRIAILNQSAFPEFSLDSLTSGFDSLQIRVWTISGLYSRTNLYVIKRKSSEWVGQHIQLDLEEKFANGDSTPAYRSGPWPFVIRKVEKIIPTGSWQQFISSMHPETLRSLEDMYSFIDPSIGITDGTGYYLEYATKNYYNRCEYFNVDRFKEMNPKIKYVFELVDALKVASNLE